MYPDTSCLYPDTYVDNDMFPGDMCSGVNATLEIRFKHSSVQWDNSVLHVNNDDVSVLHRSILVDEILYNRRQRLERYSTADNDMSAM